MTETKKTTVKKASMTTKLSAKKTVVSKKEASVAEKKSPAKVEKVIVKTAEPKKAKVKKVESNKTYATGKRKNAIAKVWLHNGTGKITVNGKPASEYLKRAILDVVINQPFERTDTIDKFDVECEVLGGGLSGQAGAIKHGISIALQLLNNSLRAPLKQAGFLTRDSRVVERKKPGLKKARKGQVFQKR
jgi:small subunit ribosomal protein S9